MLLLYCTSSPADGGDSVINLIWELLPHNNNNICCRELLSHNNNNNKSGVIALVIFVAENCSLNEKCSRELLSEMENVIENCSLVC